MGVWSAAALVQIPLCGTKDAAALLFALLARGLRMAEAQTGTSATSPTPSAAEAQPHKIKIRKPKQRACDEKDEKGKVCCGHLKRWHDYPAEIEALVAPGRRPAKRDGPQPELYRCENCKTLYKPDLREMPRSYTLRF